MRLAALPLLLAPLFIAPVAVAATNLSVCTEASPEGFDVVQYTADHHQRLGRCADEPPGGIRRGQWQVGTQPCRQLEVSPDGLTYTFKLHPDVKFHRTSYFSPSRTLTAEDVRFSFERMLDPANPWHKIAQSGFPHAQSLQLPTLVKKIDALDPLTVRFTLDHADSTFLPALSMGFASIYPAEYADKLLKAGTPGSSTANPSVPARLCSCVSRKTPWCVTRPT